MGLSGTQFAMPTDSQTLRFLFVVAAFAVYSQINRSPLTSELDASHCCFGCAWLIAIAQIIDQIFRRKKYGYFKTEDTDDH